MGDPPQVGAISVQNPVRGSVPAPARGPAKAVAQGYGIPKTVGSASRANGYRVGARLGAPGFHKNHFQTGNFITRAGFPRSNNKISGPFERLFVDGSKGAVKRQRPRPRQRPRQQQRHKRKRLSFWDSAAFRKQCGSTNRVNGERERGQPLALDLFFFLINFAYEQNLSKTLPGGEKRRIYANRVISGRFNHWYPGGGWRCRNTRWR